MYVPDNLKKLISRKGGGPGQQYISETIGIAPSLLSRILKGKVKNPGIETFIKLADALEVSVDELIGRKRTYLDKSKNLNNLELNPALMRNISEYTINYIKQHNLEITFDVAINVINDIYEYCHLRNQQKFDQAFTEWYLDKTLAPISS